MGDNKKRTVLKLKKHLAPLKAAVVPLKRNNEDLVKLAHSIKSSLQKYQIGRVVVENIHGNIGKSYRKHDEIGTPLCITIDFDSLEKNTLTIRDRDTMEQKTIPLDGIKKYFLDYFSDDQLKYIILDRDGALNYDSPTYIKNAANCYLSEKFRSYSATYKI